MKIIQLKNTSGETIFTYYKEGNSIKDTVIEAIKQRISLRGADLSHTDLRYADLRGVDLRYADLRGVDLYNADLRWANLSCVDLSQANLRDVDLTGADLRGVNLNDADLWHADLAGIMFTHSKPVLLPCKWDIRIIDKDIIRIGCKCKSIKEWDIWFAGNDVYTTPRDTDDFRLIQDNYVNVRNYIFLIKS